MAEHTEHKGEDAITHVTLENSSKSLAFFVRLKVDKGRGGEEILPVVWEDNYISMLPGERRELPSKKSPLSMPFIIAIGIGILVVILLIVVLSRSGPPR